MEKRQVKSYNGQQRINLNKNNSFNTGDNVAILHYSEYLEIKDNIKESDFKAAIKNKDNIILKKQELIKTINKNNERLINKNNKLIVIKKDLINTLETKEKEINKLNTDTAILNNKVLDLNKNIESLANEINLLNETLETKENIINDYKNQLELLTDNNKRLETDLLITNTENKQLKEIAIIKDKFYNKSIDSIILLAEKTIINEILLKVNTAIENKSRFKRFKGFNLTPADVEAKETIGNLKEELESIKETIKLN